MSINVTITAASPIELAQILQGLAAALPGAALAPTPGPALAPAPANEAPAAEQKPKRRPPEANPAAEAADTSPAPENEQAPAQQPDAAPVVTLEDVRPRLAELVRAGKQAQVKELLRGFGADKLSDVPKESLADLLEAAKLVAAS